MSDLSDIADRSAITREWYMYNTKNYHGINSSLLLFLRASEKQKFNPTDGTMDNPFLNMN